MTDGAIFNFGAQRNEDYWRVWRLTNKLTGAAHPVTNWTFVLRLNTASGLGDPPALELTSIPNGYGSVVAVEEDGANGEFRVVIRQNDNETLPGRATDIIPFACNLIATDSTGIVRAIQRGFYILEPGV